MRDLVVPSASAPHPRSRRQLGSSGPPSTVAHSRDLFTTRFPMYSIATGFDIFCEHRASRPHPASRPHRNHPTPTDVRNISFPRNPQQNPSRDRFCRFLSGPDTKDQDHPIRRACRALRRLLLRRRQICAPARQPPSGRQERHSTPAHAATKNHSCPNHQPNTRIIGKSLGFVLHVAHVAPHEKKGAAYFGSLVSQFRQLTASHHQLLRAHREPVRIRLKPETPQSWRYPAVVRYGQAESAPRRSSQVASVKGGHARLRSPPFQELIEFTRIVFGPSSWRELRDASTAPLVAV